MREIEFRGLSKATGEMVYGFYVQGMFDGTSSVVEHGIASKGCYPVEVLPETVGQYTGLKDCNGVKIFEGDIVDVLEEDEDSTYGRMISYGHAAVVYKNLQWMFDTRNKNKPLGHTDWTDYATLSSMCRKADFTVIGNIYQHPHLLE